MPRLIPELVHNSAWSDFHRILPQLLPIFRSYKRIFSKPEKALIFQPRTNMSRDIDRVFKSDVGRYPCLVSFLLLLFLSQELVTLSAKSVDEFILGFLSKFSLPFR